jgi:hypothetical protein
VLAFRQPLSGEQPANITDYLSVSSDGRNTAITVDAGRKANGGGNRFSAACRGCGR